MIKRINKKIKSKDNVDKVARPVILLVNDNSKGKKYVAFVNKKTKSKYK